MTPALVAAAAFLLGSIPFGLLLGRLFYHTDIRTKGSGNIGAANALRAFGKTGAAAVLLLDALKGFVPAAFALAHFGGWTAVLAALAAVSGHTFSPWLGGRGGKGVATSFGAIFALSWLAGIACGVVWLIGALVTGYSSVGSIAANLAAPLALFVALREPFAAAYGFAAAALVVFTHRENIARLRAGREHSMRS